MKANKEMALFTVLTGSRLYGTSTENSDFDYKCVVLPPLDTLLMNTKVSNRKEKPVGKQYGEKMLAGEVETEYLPLQVFLDDFYQGQTYALEMVCAILQHRASEQLSDIVSVHATQSSEEFEMLLDMFQELKDMFLNNNVKKMVGYAVGQSQKYGLKTQRYTSLKMVVEYLTAYPDQSMAVGKDPSIEEALVKFDHVKYATVATGKDGTVHAPAMDICGKKFPMTNKVETLVASLTGLLEGYGERVKQFDGQAIDWKALSHAYRITEQILELSRYGTLTFPSASKEYLYNLKTGQIQLEVSMANLEYVFNQIDDAVASSALPTRTPEMDERFTAWKLSKLRKLYGVI